MTTSDTPPAPGTGLSAELDHAHRNALAALDDPASSSLAAVTWAAAHLAAVEHVLFPAASRVLADGRERVHDQTAVDHRLQLVLWQLDRRLTGDVHLRSVPVQALEDDVRRALEAHARCEHALLDALSAALPPEQQDDLREQLATAMLRSPTRPHPDTRHGRLGGGLAFWFDGVVDRVRDSLDSRSVPTPHRAPVTRPVTRWGAYALGTVVERATPGRSDR
jgi:hypothetical protein